MPALKYLDFDLLIERVRKRVYRARVLASPAGQAMGELRLPFSDLELENFILKISRTRRGVRRLDSPEMQAARLFGGKLFDSVFAGELLACLRRSLDEAEGQGGGLRLRLRLNDAPELVNLPWEFLYHTALNRFLSLSAGTPIVRYLELPERIRSLAVSPPLRVLVMIASPSDYPALDADREWANLQTALGDLERRGLVALEQTETASLLALQYQLRRGDYHIFHFIGHGGFDEQAQDGSLLLEEARGRSRPVSGQHLGTILHDQRALRLAVLNACEGARTGRSDPFAGVAQSAVQQGLPAVIAMQFEVTDAAAITFAREFYTAVAEGFPVDAAMAEARKAIYALGNDVEWGTPVLYLRAPDGQIFDLASPTTSRPGYPPATRQLQQLSDALLGAFPERVGLERMLRLQLGKNLNSIATTGSLQNDVFKLLQAAEAEGWAAELLAAALRDNPGNAQLQALAGQPASKPAEAGGARAQEHEAPPAAQAAAAYEQAAQLLKAGRWQAAQAKMDEIRALDPGFEDRLGIAEIARQASAVSEAPAEQARLRQAAGAGRKEAPPAATPGAPHLAGEPQVVRIPAGPFLMGSTEEQIKQAIQDGAKRDWVKHERPQHTLELGEYAIGKYPVTNREYQAFLQESGRRPPGGWNGDQYPENKAGHPVVDVNWDDAMAYCAWLSQKTGKAYRLPSEAEWEKAARGADGRVYPWGNVFDEANANTQAARIGDTTPVGQFSPQGDSPYGCADMAGNVWEWTRSLWGKNWKKPDYSYPYDPRDGREDLGAPMKIPRVVRGGSFPYPSQYARCASRGWRLPGDRLWYFGFRVVVSPVSLGSGGSGALGL